MLKDQQDGSVLKAAVKPICGAREIQFYENLMDELSDPSIEALRKLVPEYRGTVKMSFRGKFIDFIKLRDISHDMDEPCVMDIKIGKRTWDPMATPAKILAEEQKYEACKQHLGFCIPGFQVFDIKSCRVKRYGKEYGKKLNQNTVKDGKLPSLLPTPVTYKHLITSLMQTHTYSTEDFLECRHATVPSVIDEIPINIMVHSIVGTLTNLTSAIFELTATVLRCPTTEK